MDPVQIVKDLNLPRFKLEQFQTTYCNTITNTVVDQVCNTRSVQECHAVPIQVRGTRTAPLDEQNPEIAAADHAVSVEIVTLSNMALANWRAMEPLAALDYMFEQFENDVVIIDYVVRGFTRDTDGNRVFLDHEVGSIQDYVNPQILESYHCEDLIMQRENIWQTKCLRTRLDPANFFPEGADPRSDENTKAFEDVKREMAGIFYGWPS